ncbi:hypothetical protein LCGC14_0459270 [marine sediment metagenome]|uniref:Uncharacterized protein n=1 Tax=marine sediment metagenome TaxID=412755 RepID=A0A0F9VPE0_9ZZZZ
MTKHYEHLWEEAEVVAEKFYEDQSPLKDITLSSTILECEKELTSEEMEEMLGKAIFGLCLLSRTLDINAYTALRTAIDNAKLEMLDEDIKSEILDDVKSE